MKYNSIGEQLIAKAQELDPNYKPDKFNDMSEAINIILNNSSGDSSGSGKLEGFTIDVSDTYNPETKEFSATLTGEQWAKVQNEQIYWIEVVYISNQDTSASTTLLYNGPFFVEARAFSDGNGSIMFIHDKSVEGVIIKAALTVDTQGTPTSQLIPSITTSNEQQNLTIGNGLEIKDGALKTKEVESTEFICANYGFQVEGLVLDHKDVGSGITTDNTDVINKATQFIGIFSSKESFSKYKCSISIEINSLDSYAEVTNLYPVKNGNDIQICAMMYFLGNVLVRIYFNSFNAFCMNFEFIEPIESKVTQLHQMMTALATSGKITFNILEL